ncbi:MAG TPA: response regulator transcription factor [Dehalococcoidales bacterium]|nr:response regulator transcription factor [Dehalococcoidales bacterium]
MASIYIVAQEAETARKLQAVLSQRGFSCFTGNIKDKLAERVARDAPHLVILELNGQSSRAALQTLRSSSRIRKKVPVLALVTLDSVTQDDLFLNVDDFLIQPYDERELAARAARLTRKISRQDETFRCGDLELNLAECEVRVGGKIVELTFKEYELLKFLASQPGRVFTRETLLNQVWGYDYFGGDRTVDVHVRRLRSKIELSDKIYIETVRHIGYRFTRDC